MSVLPYFRPPQGVKPWPTMQEFFDSVDGDEVCLCACACLCVGVCLVCVYVRACVCVCELVCLLLSFGFFWLYRQLSHHPIPPAFVRPTLPPPSILLCRCGL